MLIELEDGDEMLVAGWLADRTGHSPRPTDMGVRCRKFWRCKESPPLSADEMAADLATHYRVVGIIWGIPDHAD